MTLAGCAMGATTDILDLSKDTTVGNLTYDVESGNITTALNSDLYQVNDGGTQTILTFKFNLTKAQTLTENTSIFTLDFSGTNAKDVGLVATSTGLYSASNGTVSTNGKTWAELGDLSSCLTTGSDNDQYIVLTMAHIPSNAANPKGVVVYDTTGDIFSDSDARNAGGGFTIDSIYVNNQLIAAVEVNSLWPGDGKGPAGRTEAFIQTSEKSLTVPEPTTATLSLLALAGLAARRRRK